MCSCLQHVRALKCLPEKVKSSPGPHEVAVCTNGHKQTNTSRVVPQEDALTMRIVPVVAWQHTNHAKTQYGIISALIHIKV